MEFMTYQHAIVRDHLGLYNLSFAVHNTFTVS